MNENPSASDWAAERGEKWRDQLSGMEAMLAPVDKPLIEALRLDAPYRIADVGCGGGTTIKIMLSTPTSQIFPRLETGRLILREIVPADADDLFRIFSDAETMRYWSCRPYTSVEGVVISATLLPANTGARVS